MTERRLAGFVAALALVGFCREAYLHFVSEPRNEPRRMRIDDKFSAVVERVPREGEVGYLSDDPIETEQGKRRFLEMQYALAPLVLRYGDVKAPLVVVNVLDPSRLPELVARNGLELEERIGVVFALARPAR